MEEDSLLVALKNQLQETLLLFKSHLIMVLVMKLTPLVTCMILCQRNQKLISSSTSIMIRRFSDIQPDSTQKYLRIQTEDSSFHSTLLMILFQSSNLHRRIQVFSKAHSWREESTRMQTNNLNSLLQLICQQVEISRLMDITSMFQIVMNTLQNIQPLTLTHELKLHYCKQTLL